MPLTDAEAADEVARMRARQERRAFHRPQIDRYREDLLKLRRQGADFRSLSDWLARQRVPVAATPLRVRRWFDREYPALGRPKTIRKREEEKNRADVQPEETGGGDRAAAASPGSAETA